MEWSKCTGVLLESIHGSSCGCIIFRIWVAGSLVQVQLVFQSSKIIDPFFSALSVVRKTASILLSMRGVATLKAVH